MSHQPSDVRTDVPVGEMAAAISTGLVQLHRRYYGKGPTKAKTYFFNDTVVCILEGGFTTAERTMVDSGQADVVHQMRRGFQDVMGTAFKAIVQDATGRGIIAYMSQVHHNPDLAVEFFVLEPTEERMVAAHEVEV